VIVAAAAAAAASRFKNIALRIKNQTFHKRRIPHTSNPIERRASTRHSFFARRRRAPAERADRSTMSARTTRVVTMRARAPAGATARRANARCARTNGARDRATTRRRRRHRPMGNHHGLAVEADIFLTIERRGRRERDGRDGGGDGGTARRRWARLGARGTRRDGVDGGRSTIWRRPPTRRFGF